MAHLTTMNIHDTTSVHANAREHKINDDFGSSYFTSLKIIVAHDGGTFELNLFGMRKDEAARIADAINAAIHVVEPA